MRSRLAIGVALGLGIAGVGAEEKSVYKSDFDRGVGRKNWSDTRSLATPVKGERVLGPFVSNEATVLTLSDLPAHTMVRLRCEVYCLDTMDGGNPDEYDGWAILVVGGQTLLHTSFDNKWSANLLEPIDILHRAQAYPDEVSAARHDEQTGADEIGAIGFDGKAKYKDATFAVGYHLDLVFPHSGGDLALRFGGGLTKKRDESWALDDVEVSVFDPPAAVDGKVHQGHWDAIHGDDAEVANAALWKLLETGKAGIDFVLDQVTKSADEVESSAKKERETLEEKFAEELKNLESEEFAVRTRATKEISKLGAKARPLIEKALEGEPGPETKRLLGAILEKFEEVVPGEAEVDGEKVKRARVRHFLRVANTDASKAALRRLLAAEQKLGLPVEPVTLEASAAVIQGPGWGFKLDTERGCWTKWSKPENSLLWYPKEIAVGEYEVVLECATGDGTGGDRFEFLAAGQVLTGTMPEPEKAEGEGGDKAEEFGKLTLGRIVISNEGRYNFFIRPKAIRGSHLMEVKGIELKPVAMK